MIRLIQRRLIVPRGDTGTFSIPVLAGKDTGDASVFTIFNPLTHRKIFEKVMQLSDGVLTMDLSHGDTVNLPVGQFVWDIKFYTNPTIADGHIVDGEEVDSYYAAFTLPVCEIRETGDNLLFSDEAPQATLSPGQIDYITASINEVTSSKNAAAGSAAEADTSATNAGLSASAAAVSEQAAQDSQVAALASQQAAQAAATQAVEAAAQIEADLETKANIADLDDVAFSGDYNDLSNKPDIPTKISDLTDDSGHYIKPVTGIPASDLEETYLTSFTETDPTVPEWAKQAQKPTYTAQEVGAPTIQEMNTALANKMDNKFMVTLTKDKNSGAILCDTSIADIIAADEAGKLIVGDYVEFLTPTIGMHLNLAYERLYVSGMTEGEIIFGLNIGGAGTVTFIGTVKNNQDIWEQNRIIFITNNGDESSFDAQDKPLINLSTPTNDKDAANKKYVDDKVAAYTETDPTVPAWAKASTKPTYTAAEVGAPTVAEMNTAIGTAIGNVNSFDIAVVQELPTQDINTHTIYLVPKTGETNDVYDEYIYINNAWEMIGNTQIDLSNKADKADTVLETTLSRGRKENTTIGGASIAFGINTEASGYYSVALGLDTTASSQGAFAEGKNTVAHYIAHAEGENTQALGQWAHSQGVGTIAKGAASFVGGDHTIANGHASFVTGRYNAADSYDNWPTWVANTSYEVGDRVKRNLMVQNQPTDVGYHCTVANSDATFDNAHWELDGYHMNYVEIVGNGKEYEDPETHQTIRAGSNAYALEWNGTAHYMGNIYVGANADSTGGTKVLCEADFATAQDIQNIINGGVGA